MAVKRIFARAGVAPGSRRRCTRPFRTLLKSMDRAEVTIPLIAAEAGVTPSTIYRRWGDLQSC